MPAPEINSASAQLWDDQTSSLPYCGAVYLQQILPYDELFRTVFMKDQLCIVGSAATSTWKSRKLWVSKDGSPDFDYISENFGEVTGPVADCSAEEFCAHPKSTMTVKDFVSYWRQYKAKGYPSEERCLYLKDWHFTKSFPDYGAYTTPDFLCSDWLNEYWDTMEGESSSKDDYRFVYMGPKGSWTPFHADVLRSYSWSANICGRKKWIFFPPGTEEMLKDPYGQLIFDLRSDDLKDNRKFPNADLALQQAVVITQNPGEIIFVPSGWHHQVFNLEDTISINHNWMNGCSVHFSWDYLKSRLAAVQKEILDCRGMDGWDSQCQMILKADAGIDYSGFYMFLVTIARHRMSVLRQYLKERHQCEARHVQDDVRENGPGRGHLSFKEESQKHLTECMNSVTAKDATIVDHQDVNESGKMSINALHMEEVLLDSQESESFLSNAELAESHLGKDERDKPLVVGLTELVQGEGHPVDAREEEGFTADAELGQCQGHYRDAHECELLFAAGKRQEEDNGDNFSSHSQNDVSMRTESSLKGLDLLGINRGISISKEEEGFTSVADLGQCQGHYRDTHECEQILAAGRRPEEDNGDNFSSHSQRNVSMRTESSLKGLDVMGISRGTSFSNDSEKCDENKNGDPITNKDQLIKELEVAEEPMPASDPQNIYHSSEEVDDRRTSDFSTTNFRPSEALVLGEFAKNSVAFLHKTWNEILSSKLVADLCTPEDVNDLVYEEDPSEQFDYEEEPETDLLYEQEPVEGMVYEEEPNIEPVYEDETDAKCVYNQELDSKAFYEDQPCSLVCGQKLCQPRSCPLEGIATLEKESQSIHNLALHESVVKDSMAPSGAFSTHKPSSSVITSTKRSTLPGTVSLDKSTLSRTTSIEKPAYLANISLDNSSLLTPSKDSSSSPEMVAVDNATSPVHIFTDSPSSSTATSTNDPSSTGSITAGNLVLPVNLYTGSTSSRTSSSDKASSTINNSTDSPASKENISTGDSLSSQNKLIQTNSLPKTLPQGNRLLHRELSKLKQLAGQFSEGTLNLTSNNLEHGQILSSGEVTEDGQIYSEIIPEDVRSSPVAQVLEPEIRELTEDGQIYSESEISPDDLRSPLVAQVFESDRCTHKDVSDSLSVESVISMIDGPQSDSINTTSRDITQSVCSVCHQIMRSQTQGLIQKIETDARVDGKPDTNPLNLASSLSETAGELAVSESVIKGDLPVVFDQHNNKVMCWQCFHQNFCQHPLAHTDSVSAEVELSLKSCAESKLRMSCSDSRSFSQLFQWMLCLYTNSIVPVEEERVNFNQLRTNLSETKITNSPTPNKPGNHILSSPAKLEAVPSSGQIFTLVPDSLGTSSPSQEDKNTFPSPVKGKNQTSPTTCVQQKHDDQPQSSPPKDPMTSLSSRGNETLLIQEPVSAEPGSADETGIICELHPPLANQNLPPATETNDLQSNIELKSQPPQRKQDGGHIFRRHSVPLFSKVQKNISSQQITSSSQILKPTKTFKSAANTAPSDAKAKPYSPSMKSKRAQQLASRKKHYGQFFFLRHTAATSSSAHKKAIHQSKSVSFSPHLPNTNTALHIQEEASPTPKGQTFSQRSKLHGDSSFSSPKQRSSLLNAEQDHPKAKNYEHKTSSKNIGSALSSDNSQSHLTQAGANYLPTIDGLIEPSFVETADNSSLLNDPSVSLAVTASTLVKTDLTSAHHNTLGAAMSPETLKLSSLSPNENNIPTLPHTPHPPIESDSQNKQAKAGSKSDQKCNSLCCIKSANTPSVSDSGASTPHDSHGQVLSANLAYKPKSDGSASVCVELSPLTPPEGFASSSFQAQRSPSLASSEHLQFFSAESYDSSSTSSDVISFFSAKDVELPTLPKVKASQSIKDPGPAHSTSSDIYPSAINSQNACMMSVPKDENRYMTSIPNAENKYLSSLPNDENEYLSSVPKDEDNYSLSVPKFQNTTISSAAEDHSRCPHWSHCGPNLALFDLCRVASVLRDLQVQPEFSAVRESLPVYLPRLVDWIKEIAQGMNSSDSAGKASGNSSFSFSGLHECAHQ